MALAKMPPAKTPIPSFSAKYVGIVVKSGSSAYVRGIDDKMTKKRRERINVLLVFT